MISVVVERLGTVIGVELTLFATRELRRVVDHYRRHGVDASQHLTTIRTLIEAHAREVRELEKARLADAVEFGERTLGFQDEIRNTIERLEKIQEAANQVPRGRLPSYSGSGTR